MPEIRTGILAYRNRADELQQPGQDSGTPYKDDEDGAANDATLEGTASITFKALDMRATPQSRC